MRTLVLWAWSTRTLGASFLWRARVRTHAHVHTHVLLGAHIPTRPTAQTCALHVCTELLVGASAGQGADLLGGTGVNPL